MNKAVKVICIITFLLVTVLFFVCRPQKSNNEVVFWTLQMSDFAPYINGVIKDFETENPDIKIKWIDVPFSEGEKRTLASVLSDNPPDLVNLNPDFSATLAHKKALWEISQDQTSQYDDEILNSLKTDGKIYSIPWYATSAVTIYNKDLISTVPKTYDELKKYAPFVKNTAYIMLPNITENDSMLKVLNKYGCTTSNISDKQCVAVFEIFKGLYDNSYIPKETMTITLQESLEKYMAGNIALIEAGANFLNMIKENAPSTYKKTDIAPQLTGKIGQYNFSLMNFVIPLKAKHKEQALKFALFLTNDKNQLELAKLTNVLAVNKYTLHNDFYTKYDKDDLMAKARVISSLQLKHLQPVFRSQKNQKEINNLVNNAVQNILLNKDKTENILNKLENNIELLNK